VDSDGTDSVVTDIPDIAQGRVWPGAMNRVRRTRLIEEFLGREWMVRERRVEIAARIERARVEGNTEDGSLGTGQVAGLIERVEPAGDVVRRVSEEAERIIDAMTELRLSPGAAPLP
jgi:NAD(P)H-dependent flavin oxidoreductase YrpB (nitropropane dioxygenase family)